MNVRMIDTSCRHYTIVSETRKKIDSNDLYIDENQDVSVLFIEDKGDLRSFSGVRRGP